MDPDLRGVITNTASVSSLADDNASAGNTAQEPTTVAGEADLTITKSAGADPVDGGSQLTYSIEVENLGPSTAFAVVVSDTLPAAVTYVSDTGGCVEAPAGTLTCNLGDMAPLAMDMFDVTVQVPMTTTTVTNTASVTSDTTDPDAGNNSDSIAGRGVFTADLSLTKVDSADPVVAGTTLVYTLTVMHDGPSSGVAGDVTVTDTLPAGVTFVSSLPDRDSGPNPLVWNLGTMIQSDSREIVVTVTVDSDTLGVITNTAEVSSLSLGAVTGGPAVDVTAAGLDTVDPDTSNNVASQPTMVIAEADLVIAKSDAPDPVIAGQSLTYAITVTNNGPSDATGVVVTDTLPAEVSYVSDSDSCVEGPSGVLTCDLGTIAAGADASFEVLVAVDNATPAGTVITNTVDVASVTADTDTGNNQTMATTTVDTQAHLSIAKADDDRSNRLRQPGDLHGLRIQQRAIPGLQCGSDGYAAGRIQLRQ